MTDDAVPLAIKRFLDMYVEVLNERRPLRHLLTYTNDEVFQVIKLGLTRRGKGWWPVGRRPMVRSTVVPVPLRSRPVPILVQRVRSCQPVGGVVEVTAVLRRGEQVRALAVRLERQQPHWWICTALEFIG